MYLVAMYPIAVIVFIKFALTNSEKYVLVAIDNKTGSNVEPDAGEPDSRGNKTPHKNSSNRQKLKILEILTFSFPSYFR